MYKIIRIKAHLDQITPVMPVWFGISPECAYLHAIKTQRIMVTAKNSWVKDLLVAFAATTLSIILTFGTTGVINRIKQKQERRLTALMVMSSIEQFARELDDVEENLAHKDSIATWLLSIPIEEVAELGDLLMEPMYDMVGGFYVLTRDKTVDAIFSGSIETWKNLGVFRFIQNVGYAFSEMNAQENRYSERLNDFRSMQENIAFHINDYPGSSKPEKYLRDDLFRQQLKIFNVLRSELSYSSADLRRTNRENMQLIGISEKEVMLYTDNLGGGDKFEEDELDIYAFDKPVPDIDSLHVKLSYARQIDSLRRVKKGAGK